MANFWSYRLFCYFYQSNDNIWRLEMRGEEELEAVVEAAIEKKITYYSIVIWRKNKLC